MTLPSLPPLSFFPSPCRSVPVSISSPSLPPSLLFFSPWSPTVTPLAPNPSGTRERTSEAVAQSCRAPRKDRSCEPSPQPTAELLIVAVVANKKKQGRTRERRGRESLCVCMCVCVCVCAVCICEGELSPYTRNDTEYLYRTPSLLLFLSFPLEGWRNSSLSQPASQPASQPVPPHH